MEGPRKEAKEITGTKQNVGFLDVLLSDKEPLITQILATRFPSITFPDITRPNGDTTTSIDNNATKSKSTIQLSGTQPLSSQSQDAGNSVSPQIDCVPRPSSDGTPLLVASIVLFRHGARSPVWNSDLLPPIHWPRDRLVGCSDPTVPVFTPSINYRTWPINSVTYELHPSSHARGPLSPGSCNAGELTRRGLEQMLELGRFLRSRFSIRKSCATKRLPQGEPTFDEFLDQSGADGASTAQSENAAAAAAAECSSSFLSALLAQPDAQIFCRSTAFPRTLQSLLAVLTGLLDTEYTVAGGNRPDSGLQPGQSAAPNLNRPDSADLSKAMGGSQSKLEFVVEVQPFDRELLFPNARTTPAWEGVRLAGLEHALYRLRSVSKSTQLIVERVEHYFAPGANAIARSATTLSGGNAAQGHSQKSGHATLAKPEQRSTSPIGSLLGRLLNRSSSSSPPRTISSSTASKAHNGTNAASGSGSGTEADLDKYPRLRDRLTQIRTRSASLNNIFIFDEVTARLEHGLLEWKSIPIQSSSSSSAISQTKALESSKQKDSGSDKIKEDSKSPKGATRASHPHSAPVANANAPVEGENTLAKDSEFLRAVNSSSLALFVFELFGPDVRSPSSLAQAIRLTSGLLLRKLLEHFLRAALRDTQSNSSFNSGLNSSTQVGLGPATGPGSPSPLPSSANAPLWLCAAHDSTLLALLVLFDLFDWRWPPFGSAIALELYRHPSRCRPEGQSHQENQTCKESNGSPTSPALLRFLTQHQLTFNLELLEKYCVHMLFLEPVPDRSESAAEPGSDGQHPNTDRFRTQIVFERHVWLTDWARLMPDYVLVPSGTATATAH